MENMSPEAHKILLSALKLRSMGQIMWPVGGIIPAAWGRGCDINIVR